MRRTSPLHLVVLALAGAACSSDSIVAPVEQVESVESFAPTDVVEKGRHRNRADRQRTVPFRAFCTLVSQPAEPVGPGVIRQRDVGRCVAAHLGRASIVSDKVINFATGTQTVDVTFTAANGDVLRASGTGTNQMVAPGLFAFDADVTFNGGTGRFADASGSADVGGQANTTTSRAWLRANGSLSF